MESNDFVIDGDTELICDGESFWVSSAVLQARGVWWSPCSLGMDPSASVDSVTVIFPDHTKHELEHFINAVNYNIFNNSRDVLQGFRGFSVNEIPSSRLGIALGNKLDDGKSITVYKEKIPWRPWTSQSSVLSSAVFRRRSTSARGVPSSPTVTSIRQAMYKKSPVRSPLREAIKSRCQERMRADRDRIVSGVRNINMAAGPGDQLRRVVRDELLALRGGRKRLGFGYSVEDVDEALLEVADIEAELLEEMYGVQVNYAETMSSLENQES